MREIVERAWTFRAYYSIFSVIGMFIYSAPYLIWPNEVDELWIRFIGFSICFSMLTLTRDLKNNVKFIVVYWHLVLFFVMSFLPFYMLMANHFSSFWVANMTISMISLSFFVNWQAYFSINLLGITSAYFIFRSFNSDIFPNYDLQISTVLYLLILVVIMTNIIMKFTSKTLKLISKQNLELERAKTALAKSLYNVSSENSALGGKLEQALGVKKEILSNVSHEIRTPIHAIGQMSDLLTNWRELPEEKVDELISLMNNSIRRLQTFTGNLLDATKIDSNKMMFEFKQYDLYKTISEIILEFKIMAQEKNLDVRFEHYSGLNQDNFFATVDEIRIKQVFRNLLNNAIKFSHDGKIDISLEKKQDKILFSIKDQGIGIPEEELSDIWSPFIQSSRNKSMAGGTGLGLTICKGIVEVHKGKIWAENNYDGCGSTFFVELPNILLNDEEIHHFQPQEMEKLDQIKPLIMIVDDEEIVAASLEMLLSSKHYEVIAFRNPLEALEFAKNQYKKIGLILLDMMMPEMHGTNFVKIIKKNPHTDSIPVVIQSGMEDKSEMQKLKQLGITEYITKPYNKDMILSAVERNLKQN